MNSKIENENRTKIEIAEKEAEEKFVKEQIDELKRQNASIKLRTGVSTIVPEEIYDEIPDCSDAASFDTDDGTPHESGGFEYGYISDGEHITKLIDLHDESIALNDEYQDCSDERISYLEKLAMENLDEAVNELSFFGSVHYIWGLKKDILKNKYSIDWKTPEEDNPGLEVD